MIQISDPDYARIYTKIRAFADSYGWAAILHGSATRDLDVLLVPWDVKAKAENVQQIIARLVENENLKPVGQPTQMPHGRMAQNFKLPGFGDPRWIDLGWMPTISANSNTEPVKTVTDEVSLPACVQGYMIVLRPNPGTPPIRVDLYHPVVYKCGTQAQKALEKMVSNKTSTWKIETVEGELSSTFTTTTGLLFRVGQRCFTFDASLSKDKE